jgi:hypothetical protein
VKRNMAENSTAWNETQCERYETHLESNRSRESVCAPSLAGKIGKGEVVSLSWSSMSSDATPTYCTWYVPQGRVQSIAQQARLSEGEIVWNKTDRSTYRRYMYQHERFLSIRTPDIRDISAQTSSLSLDARAAVLPCS